MPADQPTSDQATVQRHAELIAALWRLQTTLEASYQVHDRQLRTLIALEARAEAQLKYLVQVLQVVLPGQHRAPRKSGGRS
jgi:hypothetical protein